MKDFLTVDDIEKIIGCKKSKAYEIIRKLNNELVKSGYIVVSGKISQKYFNERMNIDYANKEN